MSINQAAVMEVLRLALETVEVTEGDPDDRLVAYAPTQVSEEEGGIPPAINVLPCALVLPGRTTQYILRSDQHRHTYQIRVLLLLESADYTEAAFIAAVMPDRVLEVMLKRVTAAGRANSVTFGESEGLVELTWGGRTYLGYELIFNVSEAANVTPETGE